MHPTPRVLCLLAAGSILERSAEPTVAQDTVSPEVLQIQDPALHGLDMVDRSYQRDTRRRAVTESGPPHLRHSTGLPTGRQGGEPSRSAGALLASAPMGGSKDDRLVAPTAAGRPDRPIVNEQKGRHCIVAGDQGTLVMRHYRDILAPTEGLVTEGRPCWWHQCRQWSCCCCTSACRMPLGPLASQHQT